jgi:hypothetical protein
MAAMGCPDVSTKKPLVGDLPVLTKQCDSITVNAFARAKVATRCPGTSQAYCGDISYSLDGTGCSVQTVVDQPGNKTYVFSQPKKSGKITITATVTEKCCDGSGTLHTVTLTTTGTIQVALPSSGPINPCPSCSGQFPIPGRGDVAATEDGLDFRLGLGAAIPGRDAGFIWLKTSALSPNSAQPSGLTVPFERPGVEVIQGTNGVLRQVKSPQGLVNVSVVNDYEYHLESFYAADVGTDKDSNGYYPTNNAAFATWIIKNPDGGAASNRLQIIEQRGASQRQFQLTYTNLPLLR